MITCWAVFEMELIQFAIISQSDHHEQVNSVVGRHLKLARNFKILIRAAAQQQLEERSGHVLGAPNDGRTASKLNADTCCSSGTQYLGAFREIPQRASCTRFNLFGAKQVGVSGS